MTEWNEEKIDRWLSPAPEVAETAAYWRELGFRRMLDRGCGPGRHAVLFARLGFSVTGLDQSPAAVQYLSQWAAREGLDITAVRGEMEHMPFPADAFDCVVDYHGSFHTDTAGYRQMVRELERVLRPGGEVYLTLKSQRDPVFLEAPPEAHRDRFTLTLPGGAPHVYAAEEDIPELFPGFSLLSLREVLAPGRESPKEQIHFHLLLRKDEVL